MNKWMNERMRRWRTTSRRGCLSSHPLPHVHWLLLFIMGWLWYYITEWTNEWMNKWMNERMRRWRTTSRRGCLSSHPLPHVHWLLLFIIGWLWYYSTEWTNEWMNEWTNEKVEDDFTKGALVISPITPRSLSLLFIIGWLWYYSTEWMNEWTNEWTNEKVKDDFTKGALVISPITPRSLALIINIGWLWYYSTEWMNEWMNEWEGEGRLHEGGASHLTHYSTFVGSYYLLLAGCDITAQNERMNEWINEWMNEWEGGGRLHEGGACHLTHYPTFVGSYYLLLAGCDITAQNERMNEWMNERLRRWRTTSRRGR